MASSYTAPVMEGKVTSAADYLKAIARGFGGYISLRDEPRDIELPREFAPSSWHAKQLVEARAALDELLALTHEQWIERRNASHEAALAARNESIRENEEARARYEAMILKVEAWQPPTEEHAGIKEYALEQLRESIDFDCRTSSFLQVDSIRGVEDFRVNAIERARDSVAYHEGHLKEERERAASLTAWSTAFLDSLPED